MKTRNTTNMKNRNVSRRDFLGTTGAAVTALAAGCQPVKSATIMPRDVPPVSGHIPPGERLRIAGVGVGGQGHGDLRDFADLGQEIVALCDVDWNRAVPSFLRFPKATKYKDFRVMLEKEDKNIDAVVVATPDHMHAAVSLMAMKMGKHVYCEKPLTHTVYEARLMAQVAREMGVATQMGNQGQASQEIRIATEYIAAGAIGKVREVHCWCDRPRGGSPWPQAMQRPADSPPVPLYLDWDLWLGVAPERPYHSDYLPFKWRGWLDFGTGALGDIGCHSFHPIFKVLDLGKVQSVEAITTELHSDSYPLVSMIRYTFPARGPKYPAVTLTWYDGMLRPFRPDELEAERNLGGNGTLYIGDDGKIFNHRIIPETSHKAFPKPQETLPRSPGHHLEFVEACKGGPPAGANFEFAALVTEAVLLGNVALKAQRHLEWDFDRFQFTNVPETNCFLTKEYRKGWELPI